MVNFHSYVSLPEGTPWIFMVNGGLLVMNGGEWWKIQLVLATEKAVVNGDLMQTHQFLVAKGGRSPKWI